MQTGQPLDFAIVGTGFFAVRTPPGVRYTRDGQFSLERPGPARRRPGQRGARQGGAPIRVGAKGTVPASALGVFNVPNPTKQGNNFFTGAAAGRGTASSSRASSRSRASTRSTR